MFLKCFREQDLPLVSLKNCSFKNKAVITLAKIVSFFVRLLYIFNHVHPGSMLHAMFSGKFDTKPSEDGSYFIDRDGTQFRYILNYLRTGQLILPKDKVLRKELLAEAEFYQIEGIINEINELKRRALRDSLSLSSEPGVSNR